MLYRTGSSNEELLPPLQKAPMPKSPHRIRLPSITSNAGDTLRNLDDVDGKAKYFVPGKHGDAAAEQGGFQLAAIDQR